MRDYDDSDIPDESLPAVHHLTVSRLERLARHRGQTLREALEAVVKEAEMAATDGMDSNQQEHYYRD